MPHMGVAYEINPMTGKMTSDPLEGWFELTKAYDRGEVEELGPSGNADFPTSVRWGRRIFHADILSDERYEDVVARTYDLAKASLERIQAGADPQEELQRLAALVHLNTNLPGANRTS
jgi:hypothetical protein